MSHLAHTDTGHTELAEVATGATVTRVTVAHANRGGIARLTVELELGVKTVLVRGLRVLDDGLELVTTLRVAGDDLFTLLSKYTYTPASTDCTCAGRGPSLRFSPGAFPHIAIVSWAARRVRKLTHVGTLPGHGT